MRNMGDELLACYIHLTASDALTPFFRIRAVMLCTSILEIRKAKFRCYLYLSKSVHRLDI